ncbi:MAG: 30S ribosomal protein S5 [Candidatus Woesearchaeota archaeon]
MVVEPEEIESEEKIIEKIPVSVDIENWKPKTDLGRKVKNGEITDIDQIINAGKKILEPEIVDILLPNMETELLLVGQAKGKFGGGQRRIFKQTQKKTREGNKPHFMTTAVIGNKDGYVGVGSGKAKETVPAREKAYRKAKLNIIKIRRGCGSWQCGCKTPHSIPFKIKGKCGSVEIEILPAPKGTGLKIEKECQKILRLAGISDVWSKTRGCTTTKINLVNACFNALKKLTEMKIKPEHQEALGIIEGKK